jgi:uncharacterized protein YaaN involved in tellurite resistance
MNNEYKKIEIGNDDIDFIKNRILDLEKKFLTMETKMDKILEILEKDCKKMCDHIDFVENVYDNVKQPFYYVMNKVSYLVSNDNKNILDSEHNENNEDI